MRKHQEVSRIVILAAVAAAAFCATGAAQMLSAEEQEKLEKQRCPKPTELASVFSFGYAGDQMPKDDAKFEELLKKIKEGGFNVIHTSYTDNRLALCKKHGVKLMIDFLDVQNHHVYKNVAGCKAVCAKVRGDDGVWGYNIYNDSFGKRGEGRRRDVNNVRQWDPTHPAYAGTYRTYDMRHLVNADVMGYYDFHWSRGTHYHFAHLMRYLAWARERDAIFYRWAGAGSGRPGQENFRRSLYTANTSLACGLKGILWFLATAMMDKESLEWTQIGKDIVQVNQEIMPLREVLAALGNPVAVYSTPITRTLKNTPLPDGKESMMPPGLENCTFPADFALQPAGGEFVMGVFHDAEKRLTVLVANHNAGAEQNVQLKPGSPGKVSLFDRKNEKWQDMSVTDGCIRFTLPPGGGELLRFEAERAEEAQ